MSMALLVCLAQLSAGTDGLHAENRAAAVVPYETSVRFAAVSVGARTFVLHVRRPDAALCLGELDPGSGAPDADPIVIHAPVAGPAYPRLVRWRDLLVASFFDGSDGTLYVALAKSPYAVWTAYPVQGLTRPNGWHDLLPSDESLELLYASDRRGVLMRSRVVLDSDGARAGRTDVVDDGAVSKGGANLSHLRSGGELLVVYNGAYHGFGQGKSLKLARSVGDGEYRIHQLDGPACSVGNAASATLFGDKLLVLAADRTGAHLYTLSLDQRSDTAPVKQRFADFQGADAITACCFCRTRDECLAVVQRWPQLVVRQVSPTGLGPSRTIDVGQRFSADAPGSDLLCVSRHGRLTVLYYDPVERSIRALLLEPTGDTD